MAIRIPVYLVNQTGPQWQKFANDAAAAGVNAQEAASRTIKKITTQNYNEITKSAMMASNATGGLSEKIKTLNALNITPYGFERMAYRMSVMAEAAPALVISLGAVAAVAATAAMAIGAGMEKAALLGTDSFKEMEKAAKDASEAWDHMGFVMARNSAVTGSGGVGNFWSQTKQTFFELTEEISLGAPKIRGALAYAFGDKETLASMKDVVDYSNKLAEADRKLSEQNKGRKLLDDVAAKDKQKDAIKEIDNIERLMDIEKKRKQLQFELLDVGKTEKDPAKNEKERQRIGDQIVALNERERDVKKEIQKIQKDVADAQSQDDEFLKKNMLDEIKTQQELDDLVIKEEKVINDINTSLKQKKEAVEKIKEIEKMRVDLLKEEQKEEKERQKQSREFAHAQAAMIDDLNHRRQKAHNDEMKRIAESRKRQSDAFDEQRRREQQGKDDQRQQNLEQGGGADSIRQQLANQDPRKVRKNFIENRMESMQNDPKFQAMTKEEQARERRKTISGAQRDWKQGRQNAPGELAGAQAETFQESAATLQAQGKLTAEQVRVLNDVTNRLLQQQQEIERQQQELRGISESLAQNPGKRAKAGNRN